MPANNNNGTNKIRTALDTEVCQKVITLEREFYRYIDKAMPKKHKYTLVAACVQRLMNVRDVIVAGMDFDVNLYAPQKHRLLSEARAMLRNITVDMQHLNDLGDISNEAKARFDLCMDDIQLHLGKLLNSLSKRMDMASASREGTPTRDAQRL